ncbi:hypothetical protein [Nannocystis pusilla]|uniref:hypothetical protein n=1 Tax=Nannocystis pusilla TaxID=889268 RepID=UPI003DA4340F
MNSSVSARPLAGAVTSLRHRSSAARASAFMAIDTLNVGGEKLHLPRSLTVTPPEASISSTSEANFVPSCELLKLERSFSAPASLNVTSRSRRSLATTFGGSVVEGGGAAGTVPGGDAGASFLLGSLCFCAAATL